MGLKPFCLTASSPQVLAPAQFDTPQAARFAYLTLGVILTHHSLEERVSFSKTLDLFTSRPLSSLVLALLMVLLGVVAVSGIVPASDIRRYFAGHEWLLAAVCWLMAAIFTFSAIKGWRLSERKAQK